MKLIIKTIVLSLLFLLFSSCATRTHRQRHVNKTTVIKAVPKDYKIVNIRGQRYYKWNNTHYKKTKKGYVVVRL